MESTRKYKKVKKDKAPKVLNQAIDLQGDDYENKKPEEVDEESEDYLIIHIPQKNLPIHLIVDTMKIGTDATIKEVSWKLITY